MYSQLEEYVIWLDSFLELDYKVKEQLLSQASPSDIFENLNKYKDFLVKEIGEEGYSIMERHNTMRYLEYILSALEKRDIKVITMYSDNYPESLLNTPNPPIILYCMGNADLLYNENLLTIVGSRQTLPQMLGKSKEFATALSQNGFTIVTGMAHGADTAVLEGALESGNVICVLASGIDDIYPEQSRPLVNKVAQKGLVITEHNPGVKSKPYLFPIRNRIMAGLSKGVLVTSGGLRSGTNYTASFAVDYGKDVFAFPYNIGVESGEVCNMLIRNGAILVTKPEDIAECYNVQLETKQENLTPEEEYLYNIIRQGDIHIEQLSIKTNQSVVAMMPTLLLLEMKGKIVKDAGNVYTAL